MIYLFWLVPVWLLREASAQSPVIQAGLITVQWQERIVYLPCGPKQLVAVVFIEKQHKQQTVTVDDRDDLEASSATVSMLTVTVLQIVLQFRFI